MGKLRWLKLGRILYQASRRVQFRNEGVQKRGSLEARDLRTVHVHPPGYLMRKPRYVSMRALAWRALGILTLGR